jgi:hypothetical protein
LDSSLNEKNAKRLGKMKKPFRIRIVFLISILALALPTASHSADITPKDLLTLPIFGTVIQEGQAFQNISFVTASSTPQDGGSYYNKACTSFEDPRCADAPIIRGNLIMPVCQSAADKFCVESLEFTKNDGSKESAKLVLEATTQKIPASTTYKTGAGGGISVWNAAKTLHKGATGDYIVKVAIGVSSVKGKLAPRIDGVEASVTPVVMTQDAGAKQARACEKPDPGFGGNPNTSYGWACPDNQPNPATYERCSQLLDGLCFMRQDFITGTRVGLNLRINNQVTGWLFGRMSEPNISVTAIDPVTNLLKVEGVAQSVPTLVGYVEKKNLSQFPEIQKRFEERCKSPGFYTTCEKMIAANFFDGSLGSGVNRFDDYELFSKQIKAYAGTDLNFKIDTNWSFGSTSYQGRKDAEGACFADSSQLLGLVTTNAPIYESGPPKLTEGFLTYKVAGAHHNADGSVFKGTYDFALRSTVARCLYGFTSAPIQSTVSVTSGDGSITNVASEIVQERNGWMTLSAKNFTFSAPIIRIKLSQAKAEAPVQPTATPAAVAQSATPVAKSATITCIKGKLIKKVTAVKPTCPKGYKKK